MGLAEFSHDEKLGGALRCPWLNDARSSSTGVPPLDTYRRDRHATISPTCGRLTAVGRYEELRLRILQGQADANIDFDALRRLLEWLGFEERIRGSHHIFRKQGVRELVNLQQAGSKAKVYQVRQVRRVILQYGLEGREG